MALSNDLISQFVKATKDNVTEKKETIVYGTIQSDVRYVKIDGSDILTPISTTTVVGEGDRVTLVIENHTAIVTGNISSPAARSVDTLDVVKLNVQKARIDELETANVNIQNTLKSNNADIENLKAKDAELANLIAGKIDASSLEAEYAKITRLEVSEGKISALETSNANILGKLTASEADINTLKSNSVTTTYLTSNYLTANEIESTYVKASQLAAEYVKTTTLESNYAKVDFANVSTASIGTVLANAGLITSATIVDGHVTGYLDSVQINANDITAGTLTVDRLVISGTDKSIVYALNNAGDLTSTEVDTINGDVITKRTIAADHIIAGAITANELHSSSVTSDKIAAGAVTAGKISVTSLESIVAKIGSFTINSALYSNGHSAYNTSVNGVYIGSDYISLGNGGKSWLKNDGSVSIGNGAINYNATTGAVDINATSVKMASKELALKTDVDDIEIGGRNLLLDSNKTYENASYVLGQYTYTNPSEIVAGETYTVSFDGMLSDTVQTGFYINTYPSPHKACVTIPAKTIDGKYYHYKATFTMPDNGSFTTLGFYSNSPGNYKTAGVKNVKLEKGNKATDWTPAPEDVESDILDASKTATNYLNFSSSGLVVGDMTASTLGKNALIDTEGFKVRSGTTVNSFFGADIIELAKSNESATISMLNGRFKIYYDSDPTEKGFGIYGRTSAGVDRLAFQPVNENNNLTLGWGGYDAKANSSNIYGHKIHIVANEEITIGSAYSTSGLVKNLYLASSNELTIDSGYWKINEDGNLFGKATSGSFVELIGLSSDNNTAIGHGGYTSALGKTNIYGNKINHVVNTTSGSATYKPYYEAGDSFELEWYGSGFVSSSSSVVFFTIPLAKPVIGATTPTVSISRASGSGLRVRQEGEYVYGATSSTHAIPSSYKTAVSGDGNFIRVEATMGNTTNAINNSSCGIHAKFTLTFS